MNTNSGRRVLHVAQPTTEGTALVVRDLVRAGVRAGDEVTVACPEGGDLAQWVESAGAAWIRVPMTRAPSWADVRAIRRVGRLMGRADLVVAHSSKAGAVARLARFLFRVSAPLVFVPHGWSWLTGGRAAGVYRVFERWAAARADAIVCVSTEEAEEGRRVLGPGPRLDVIRNGVDLDELSSNEERAARDSAPLIVVVGRLSRQKGQDLAITALARMREGQARLRLVGDGPEAGALEKLASALGVADRVELVGRTPSLPHLRVADVVWVPSRWEGLSLALLEAMALGRPVIATEAGSGGALGDAGLVVSAQTDAELAEGLARATDTLLVGAERRADLGRRAARRAEEGFSLDRTKAGHLALWAELANPAGRAVNLLWLESTASGTAAETHLSGTLRRLAACGRRVGLVLADSRERPRTTRGRISRIGRLVLRGVLRARAGTLLVRVHPLAAPVVWAWKRKGARVVISVQGPLSNARSDGGAWARLLPVDALTHWQLRRADALVTVTAGLVTQLRTVTNGEVPVTLIPNGIDIPEAVTPVMRARRYACFAGNLAAWQGVEVMLAATRSRHWPEGVDLVVVGDGALSDVVAASGSGHVDHRGRLPKAETQAWLAGSVCSFSLQDPDHPAGSGGYWPFKVLEAAALGVPVILSDAPGLPEMAQKLGHAVVCGYDDADAVAAAVARLSHDDDYRCELAEAGRVRVRDYTWEAGAGPLNALL